MTTFPTDVLFWQDGNHNRRKSKFSDVLLSREHDMSVVHDDLCNGVDHLYPLVEEEGSNKYLLVGLLGCFSVTTLDSTGIRVYAFLYHFKRLM
jgi:hypothetical protein